MLCGVYSYSAHLKIEFFTFKYYLCILDDGVLSNGSFVNIFSQLNSLPYFLDGVVHREFFYFHHSRVSDISFMDCILDLMYKMSLLYPRSCRSSPMIPPRSFVILHLMCINPF